jgi:hypothetical protein
VACKSAQQPTQRAQFLELRKDEPHNGLNLLVGVELDRSVGVPHIATGQRKRERSPTRFAQAALIEPLFEQMQLGLTHGSLQPQ